MRFKIEGQNDILAVEFKRGFGEKGRRRTYIDVLKVDDTVRKEDWLSLYSAYSDCSLGDTFNKEDGRERAIDKLTEKPDIPVAVVNGVLRVYYSRRNQQLTGKVIPIPNRIQAV